MLLLPDETYDECKDQNPLASMKALQNLLINTKFEPHITKTDSDEKISSCTSKIKFIKHVQPIEQPEVQSNELKDFEKISEFFNNIPEFVGEPLRPFRKEDAKDRTRTEADIIKECERFLQKYRIKPDFFCRYRKALE